MSGPCTVTLELVALGEKGLETTCLEIETTNALTIFMQIKKTLLNVLHRRIKRNCEPVVLAFE